MIAYIIALLRKQTIKQLRKRGAIIGENVSLLATSIDINTAFLIEIGDNTTITNATVLAHDASTKKYLGYTRIQKTIIGSNVFVGMGSIVLAGSHIGNNVIIGAGSVVKGVIPDNCVAVGNPARVISSFEDFLSVNSDALENGIVVDKMCSQMKMTELRQLRDRLGEELGFEL